MTVTSAVDLAETRNPAVVSNNSSLRYAMPIALLLLLLLLSVISSWPAVSIAYHEWRIATVRLQHEYFPDAEISADEQITAHRQALLAVEGTSTLVVAFPVGALPMNDAFTLQHMLAKRGLGLEQFRCVEHWGQGCVREATMVIRKSQAKQLRNLVKQKCPEAQFSDS